MNINNFPDPLQGQPANGIDAGIEGDLGRQKFIHDANDRTEKVISALRYLGKLANRSQDYCYEDVKEIVTVIQRELIALDRRLSHEPHEPILNLKDTLSVG